MDKIHSYQTDLSPFENGLWRRAWFILLISLALAAVDWELISLKIFPFVFIFPVMLAAWNRRLRFAVLCAAGLSITRLAHQFAFSERPDSFDDAFAATVRFFVLLLLAALTSLLARQARQLRDRVRLLEGVLPICARCKSIRDENNNWVQLEHYISARSAARFSHGFCPDCFKAYYGDQPAPAPDDKKQ